MCMNFSSVQSFSGVQLLVCNPLDWSTPGFAVIEFQLLSLKACCLLQTMPYIQFSSVQSLSCVPLFATPQIVACWASLSITNSQSLLKLMSIESVMPYNLLILCSLLLLLNSIFPSIRVYSNESVLCTRWAKHRRFSFNIKTFNEYSGLISFRIDWFELAIQGLSRVFSNTTVQKHQFFSSQLF